MAMTAPQSPPRLPSFVLSVHTHSSQRPPHEIRQHAWASVQELENELLVLLLPRDPLDEKNIMLEIRAGTGGDEASIWAGDLLRMYQKYCAVMNWKSAIINWNDGESGGYKEATLEIKGDSVYSRLKYEAGALPPPAPLPCTSPPVRAASHARGLQLQHMVAVVCNRSLIRRRKASPDPQLGSRGGHTHAPGCVAGRSKRVWFAGSVTRRFPLPCDVGGIALSASGGGRAVPPPAGGRQ